MRKHLQSTTILLFVWILLSCIWLISNTPFSYDSSSDMGFHIFNTAHISESDFSWYNNKWYWGQEYLVVYSPGAYLLGSLFSWVAPGISGAIISIIILVLISSLLSLYGMYYLIRNNVDDKHTDLFAMFAAVLYTYSHFFWGSFRHSLPDIISYGLIPITILCFLSGITSFKNKKFAYKQLFLCSVLIALLIVTSTIVAYHVLVALGIYLIVKSVQTKTIQKQQYIVFAVVVGIGVLLSMFWSLQFASFVLDPEYGAGKINVGEGNGFITSTIAALHPKVIANDIVQLFNPFSRHTFPLLLVMLCIPMAWLYKHSRIRTYISKNKEILHYIVILAIISFLLGTFTFVNNFASFGMELLQEKGRWFDIFTFSISILAAYTLTQLWQYKFRTSRARSISRGIMLSVIALLAITSLCVYSNTPVKATIADEQPVFDFLANDMDTYRIAEFPYLYFAPSSLVHGKDQVFGSCQYCNRNDKIRASVVYEDLVRRQVRATQPYSIDTTTISPFLGELNTKYAIVYDNHYYPDINLGVNTTGADILTRAPDMELVFTHSREHNVRAWQLLPKHDRIQINEDTLIGTKEGFIASLSAKLICSLPDTNYIAVSCSPEEYIIQLLELPAAGTDGNVYIPTRISPVLDRTLQVLRIGNVLNPLFTIRTQDIAHEQTTYVFENMNVQERISSPALISNITHTPRTYTFMVSSSQDSPILVREGYSPYWKAYSNDKKIPISNIEPGIMGIAIPAGEAQVTLQYTGNPLAKIGLWISILTLLSCVYILYMQKKQLGL